MKITLQIAAFVVLTAALTAIVVGMKLPNKSRLTPAQIVVVKYRAAVAECEAQRNDPATKAFNNKVEDMSGSASASCKDTVLEHLSYSDRMTVQAAR